MYFIDTNIFLRFFTGDLPRMQKDCISFFEKVDQGKLPVASSQVVMAEIVWTLGTSYKFSKAQVLDAATSALRFSRVLTEDYNSKLALSLFGKHSVKYIDCLVASIPQIYQKKWTVVSYDRDFDKLGVQRVEPGNIV
jgi:predicted nucleic acid-binding protein